MATLAEDDAILVGGMLDQGAILIIVIIWIAGEHGPGWCGGATELAEMIVLRRVGGMAQRVYQTNHLNLGHDAGQMREREVKTPCPFGSVSVGLTDVPCLVTGSFEL